MRAHFLFCLSSVALISVFTSKSADAHFKVLHPADALDTDEAGDPNGSGGTQKLNPCGAGTASGMVTQVHAGAKLHIKLTETVPHGGHYRIALLPKYDITSNDIPEPAVTLSGGQCSTAAVQSPVVAPVIADNLFVHTQAEAESGKLWETDVTLPTTTGPATLQILEFMTPHSPQCFYHHCAKLEIMPPEADLGPSGEKVIGPGGAVTPDPGSSGSAGSSGSSGSDTGSTGSSGSSGKTTSGGSKPAASDDGGCNVGGGATPSLLVGGLGLAGVIATLRRRRKR